jgi:hypothetical protein
VDWRHENVDFSVQNLTFLVPEKVAWSQVHLYYLAELVQLGCYYYCGLLLIWNVLHAENLETTIILIRIMKVSSLIQKFVPMNLVV